MCRGSDVVVVGGGNSAGQAAVFLAGQVRKVLPRGPRRRPVQEHVELPGPADRADPEHRGARATRRSGGCPATATSTAVELVNNKTGEARTLKTPALFSFIGAVPRTDWLPPEIERDAKAVRPDRAGPGPVPHWTARRQPFLLETSRPGVFAAGDVRSGSVKRVASAVGEGAMAVQFVHEYLKEK